MVSLNLWTEITLSGLFYLGSIFFIVLKLIGVYDFSMFFSLKDFSTLIFILLIFVSYLLGILVLRLIPMIFSQPLRFIVKIFKIRNLTRSDKAREEYQLQNVIIFQNGSERLQKEIDTQYSFLALFTSLTFSLPLLSLCVSWWIIDTPGKQAALPIIILGAVLGFVFLFVTFRQRKLFYDLREQAIKHLTTNILKMKGG